MTSAAKPVDAVDTELLKLLKARSSDGSLKEEARVWGLERPAVVKELRLLATASEEVDADAQARMVGWYESNVPLLFEQLVCRLFVGLNPKASRIKYKV